MSLPPHTIRDSSTPQGAGPRPPLYRGTAGPTPVGCSTLLGTLRQQLRLGSTGPDVHCLWQGICTQRCRQRWASSGGMRPAHSHPKRAEMGAGRTGRCLWRGRSSGKEQLTGVKPRQGECSLMCIGHGPWDTNVLFLHSNAAQRFCPWSVLRTWRKPEVLEERQPPRVPTAKPSVSSTDRTIRRGLSWAKCSRHPPSEKRFKS